MRTKKIVFLLVLAFSMWLTTVPMANTQILDPADWKVTIYQNSSKTNERTVLGFTVHLEEGWYIYAPDQDPDLGPVPTSVVFEKSDAFTPLGEPKPVKVKEKYDEVWEGTVRIIEESGGGFIQKIQVLKANPVIRGRIVYTVCSEKTGQCLFPEETFELTLTTKNH